MRGRLAYVALSLMAIVAMVLASCGPDEATTATPAPGGMAQAAQPDGSHVAGGRAGSISTDQPGREQGQDESTAASAGVGATASTMPRPVATAKPGTKVLRVRVASEPRIIDPQKASFVDEIGFAQLVFEGLFELDGKQQPVPAAAEKMQVSSDGTRYTVTLKKGLTYSDGTPLVASDFEYAWRRLLDPRVSGRDYASIAYIIKGARELSELVDPGEQARLRELWANLGIKSRDDQTIEFELLAPAPYFPYLLALWVGWPTRQDMVEKAGGEWTEPGSYIGNGPYVLTQRSRGNTVVFEGNERYRKGKPRIDRIEMRVVGDPAAAFEAYKRGELDVTGVAPEDLAAIRRDPQLSEEFMQIDGNCTYYLGMNVQRAPFDSTKVRQAFARAFDRRDWIAAVFQGIGQPAYSFIPPGRPGHAPELRQPEHNAAEARQLLEAALAADYPGGLPPIKLTFSASPRNQVRFEWMRNQIKTNLGVEAALDPVESDVYSELVRQPETAPQLFYLGWCQDYPDPQNWLSLVFRSDSTVTRVGWKNMEFDRLTADADLETDQARRLDLYSQAHKILVEEAPAIFLYYNVTPLLIKPYVKGMREAAQPNDMTVPGFRNIRDIDIER